MIAAHEISVMVHCKEDVNLKTRDTTTELTLNGDRHGLTTISIIMPNCVKEWLVAEMIKQAMEKEAGRKPVTFRITGVMRCTKQ